MKTDNNYIQWVGGTTLADGTCPVDASANQTSLTIYLNNMVTYSISLVFTGSTIAGTAKLQFCNDVNVSPYADGPGELESAHVNWIDVPNSSQTNATAASIGWNYALMAGYRMARIVWTAASGTGNIAGASSYMVKGL